MSVAVVPVATMRRGRNGTTAPEAATSRRETIRDVVFAFQCTHWDAGAKHDLAEEIEQALAFRPSEDEGLREAVEPFADALGDDDADEPDHTEATLVCGRSTDYSLDLGDFRRARAALKGER